MKRGILYIIGLLAIVLSSCNLTKFVPENKALLTRVKIESDDKNKALCSDMQSYLRQQPNTKVLGFWPLSLCIYNTAPADTTTKARKRLAQNAFRMGQAPVIYSSEDTHASMVQLQRALQNRGYFNATIDTFTTVRRRHVHLRYVLHPGRVYQIKSYQVALSQNEVRSLATEEEALPQVGAPFNSNTLDAERQRIATAMRRNGYFYFEKGVLDYEADSSYQANEVSVRLRENPLVSSLPDTVREKLYRQMYIASVEFHLEDPKLIRQRVLHQNCAIRPGDLYNEFNVERTYAMLNQLGPVKYVDISFTPVAADSLHCDISITRSKTNSVSAEIEGTYSAGDWGIAAGVGYQNKNIFRGAERLTLNARTSYEWRQNGGRAIEGKVEAGLEWPNSLRVNIAYNYQSRPDEYTRTIANAGLSYAHQRYGSRWRHMFNLVDINYVWLPWMSEQYRKEIVDRSSILRYSYENHFILDWSYVGTFSSQRPDRPHRSYINFRYSVETAGNLLYGISKLAGQSLNEQNQYEIFGIPYAQYAKADVNFTFHQYITPAHQLVYHLGVGAAVPYLNASSVPFEKRYFSGGSNSVRGWQARTLGPGAFGGIDGNLRYDLQAGDIHLDLNLEYRWNVWSFLELAAFTDAGNIWTIRDYETQPGGVFLWNQFFRQVAWAYGAGVRLNFTVLVLRVDFGVKLYDPTRLNTDGLVWRTAANGLGWNRDMTFHFAIGYPF